MRGTNETEVSPTSRPRTVGVFLGSWLVVGTWIWLALTDVVGVDFWPSVYVSLFFFAPFLNRVPSVAARLIARAFWFQSAFLYSLLGGYALYRAMPLSLDQIENINLGWHALAPVLIWLGPVVALGSAGTKGLSIGSKHFAPTRFRRAMLLSLLLGLADTLALAMYTVISAHAHTPWGPTLLLAACTLIMSAALFGLFRMRIWGLLLCVLANAAIAVMAVSSLLNLPEILAGGLAATAVVQLFVPIPMIREILTSLRKRPEISRIQEDDAWTSFPAELDFDALAHDVQTTQVVSESATA